MKLLKIFSLFILGATLFTACNKDKDDVSLTLASMAGVYEGKYGNDAADPSIFYSFNLKADGTMVELNNNGEVIGTGTWTITGTTFRTSHHWLFPVNSFFVATGNYDIATNKITGTWGYGSSDSDGGKWYMTKK